MMDFREPFLANVLKGGWRGNGEADKEDVSLGVRERSKAIVIFLSSCIEETKRVRLVTDPI